MGLDITVLAVDWDAESERGWVWPAASGVPWWVRYEFHGTIGSFKPHFWAGQAWEDVREHAGPEQRAHLDAFLQGLFWDAGTGTEDDTGSGLFALVCHWARAEPLLESLREPYGVRAACPGRWIADFDEFSVLLREWGVVVTQAGRRGWGLIGLPLCRGLTRFTCAHNPFPGSARVEA
ncbi:hypothetical protein [Streptomyces swartbergensis]|uniref:hypothetical protein n=1 Tax=Streptomyces swartbergensis TaxID=487165 RepID=UPI001ABF0876|nr:hypothetical protein [Streptomyces swartbergensis]